MHVCPLNLGSEKSVGTEGESLLGRQTVAVWWHS